MRLPVPPPPHVEGTTTDERPTTRMIAKATAFGLTQVRAVSTPERVYHGTGERVRASFIRFLHPPVSVFPRPAYGAQARSHKGGPGAPFSSRYFSTLEYWYFRGIESKSFRAEKREASTTNVNHGKDRNSATSGPSVRNPSCQPFPVTPANGGRRNRGDPRRQRHESQSLVGR